MTEDTGNAETDTEQPDDDRDPVVLSNGAPGDRYVCDRCGTARRAARSEDYRRVE
jgi:hypothetical protein